MYCTKQGSAAALTIGAHVEVDQRDEVRVLVSRLRGRRGGDGGGRAGARRQQQREQQQREQQQREQSRRRGLSEHVLRVTSFLFFDLD